jgi:hypothetical protein
VEQAPSKPEPAEPIELEEATKRVRDAIEHMSAELAGAGA